MCLCAGSKAQHLEFLEGIMEKKGILQELADYTSFINSILLKFQCELLGKHKLLSLIFVKKHNSI